MASTNPHTALPFTDPQVALELETLARVSLTDFTNKLTVEGASPVDEAIRIARARGKVVTIRDTVQREDALTPSAWYQKWEVGAGEGNRTLVISLEGCCSTIELHPRTGGGSRRTATSTVPTTPTT